MARYIVKRVLLGFIVFMGVIVITFTITHLLPVDAAYRYAGSKASPEKIEQARAELRLDQPLWKQFCFYVADLFQGDLGRSYVTKRPVAEELGERIPATLELVFYSSIFGTIVGIFMGISAAKHKNKLADHVIRTVSIGLGSFPSFVGALLLQVVFHSILGWLPLSGRLSMETQVLYEVPNITGWLTIDCLLTGEWEIMGDAIVHLVLPCLDLSIFPMSSAARMVRSIMMEVMGEDYITACRSYGIRERLVYWKYALKNTYGTVATSTALTLGTQLVGTFLVEAIFGWPGIGSYVADAVTSYNYSAVMGVTIVTTLSYLILNLVADLIVATDPRVRL